MFLFFALCLQVLSLPGLVFLCETKSTAKECSSPVKQQNIFKIKPYIFEFFFALFLFVFVFLLFWSKSCLLWFFSSPLDNLSKSRFIAPKTWNDGLCFHKIADWNITHLDYFELDLIIFDLYFDFFIWLFFDKQTSEHSKNKGLFRVLHKNSLLKIWLFFDFWLCENLRATACPLIKNLWLEIWPPLGIICPQVL